MVGFKASVQRTGFQVSLARWRAQLREQEASSGAQERVLRLARCFKQSDLDIAHRRLVQSVSVWGGASPMGHTLVTLSCDEK